MRELEEALSPFVVAAALLFFLALAGLGTRCEVHIDSRPTGAGVKP